MSRSGNDEYRDGKLYNGFDYDNQYWVVNGIIQRCGHPEESQCNCYGRLHAGESVKKKTTGDKLLDRAKSLISIEAEVNMKSGIVKSIASLVDEGFETDEAKAVVYRMVKDFINLLK